ncbi:FERM domain-containing protein 4A [Ditylenchus destructor]|nr:FERM domain-containing protein 4A [Ditylenchus destructor]
MNASGERKYAIHLLNGEVVQLDAGPKILLTEILRKVDEYCGFSFTKTGCFQLAFIDERKHVFWIKDGGSIADHIDLPRVSRSTIQLYHLPRFYKDLFSQKDPQLLIYLFFDARAQFLQSKFMDMGHAQFARCCACLILLSSAELSDESTILLAYENQISPSIEQLRQLDISIEELHYIVIKECKLLSNFNHGELILEFLSLVEKSSNFYGSYFYNVSEKSGDNIKLAVNGRALMFFCYADLSHPKRIVYWQHVEKISHDKKQIVLEINARTGWPASPANGHLAKDHVSLSNLSPAKRSSSRMSNNESPMFRQHASFSISTSNSPSRSSQRVVFTCENESLCKAIWDSIIAQHQYFLDQRTSNKAYTTENEASLLRKELAEKLNQELIKLSPGTATALGVVTGVEIHQVVSPTSPSQHKSSCSLSSSQQCAAFSLFKSSSIQPQHSSSSIDSLAFSFSGMPSAKVADGHISRNIHAINCDRTEEDKKRDMELAAKLAEQRRHLEDILLQKLDDLKALCIQEGEITGKLPVEIYKTLLPGEPEPVVKRRVGTAFKFTDEVLQQANLDGNRQAQLELDIELHRKIVAAAERLAKDKNTNKSVRKKRRKDLQAASLKLKGLEKGLHKLRMCNSKPDSLNWLETSSMSQAGSGFSLNSLRTWSNFTGQPLKGSTKSCPNSCPTTPHGSVPDLRAEDVKHKKKTSFRFVSFL